VAVNPGNLPLSIIRGIEFDSVVLQFRDEGVTVTGTLNPNVAGTFTPHGTFGAYPLFILEGSPSTFLYFNTTAASYVIARLLTQAALIDFWVPAAPITEPTGTYVPQGANTGTATATDHPVDLTGYGVEAKVRRTVNASDVFIDLNPSITTPATGEITIPSMNAATTNALGFTGNFMWDLVLTLAGDRFGPYVKGSFTVSDNITQYP
jgi:hypothetical protein